MIVVSGKQNVTIFRLLEIASRDHIVASNVTRVVHVVQPFKEFYV